MHPDHTASNAVAAKLGLYPTGELDDEGEMIWKEQWLEELMPYTFASGHQLRPLVLLLPLDEVIDYVASVSADGEQRV